MPFVNHACWKKENVSRFIRSTAQTTHREAFLAVHMPFDELHVDNAADPGAVRTDRGLRDYLHGVGSHVVVAIEGDPGSGKSHLIQWLEYTWPESEGDLVLMVPRHDGTLLGTLELLRTRLERLGASYAEPLIGLIPTNALTEEAEAPILKSYLALWCDTKAIAAGQTQEDSQWLDDMEARGCLEHLPCPPWGAPIRILRLLRGASDTGAPRDQQVADFQCQDVIELLDVGKLTPKVAQTRMFKALDVERMATRRAIEHAKARGEQPRDQDIPPNTRRFLNALKARLNLAFGRMRGMTVGELKRKFLEVRRRLQTDGKRLVLFLEDITSLQGVDGELFEALWASRDSDASLCPLVAVIGYTPQYRVQYLPDNALDRFAVRISLTTPGERSQRLLDSDNGRQQFVATYLDAIRHGKNAVTTEAATRTSRCSGCEFQKQCHATFGSVALKHVDGPVGLYPFNLASIEHFWTRLNDFQGKNVHTPRGLLIQVMEPVLSVVGKLESGEFPPTFGTSMLVPVLLGPQAKDRVASLWSDPGTRARAQQVIQWWGDWATGVLENESKIYDAFGFPSSAVALATLPVAVTNGTATTFSNTTNVTTNTKSTKGAPSEFQVRQQELLRWDDGKDVVFKSRNYWQSLVYFIIEEVPPEHHGVQRWLWKTVFTKDNVVLQEGGSSTKLKFIIPSGGVDNGIVVRGLEALSNLTQERIGETARSAFQVEANLIVATAFAEWITGRAVAHVKAITASLVPRETPRLEHLAVRLATMTGWLSSTTHPDAPLTDQWKVALTGEINTIVRGRSSQLEALHVQVRGRIDAIRGNIGQALRIGPGEKLHDPHLAWEALAGWDGAWDEVRKTGYAVIDERFITVVGMPAGVIDREFAKKVLAEWINVNSLSQVITNTLGDVAFGAFAQDVHKIVAAVMDNAQHLVPTELWTQWITAQVAFKALGAARIEAVQTLVEEASKHSPNGLTLRKQLTICSMASPADLQVVEAMVAKGKALVSSVHQAAEKLVTSQGPNTDQLTKFSTRIKVAVTGVRRKIA